MLQANRRTARVDLACGHGLTAALLLLLDDSSPQALAVDHNLPASSEGLHACLIETWPRLADRIHLIESPLEKSHLNRPIWWFPFTPAAP